MNNFTDLLDDLYYFVKSSPNYSLSPENSEQEDLRRLIDKRDEKTIHLIFSVMEEWQRHGFVNGFSYAVQLFKECFI